MNFFIYFNIILYVLETLFLIGSAKKRNYEAEYAGYPIEEQVEFSFDTKDGYIASIVNPDGSISTIYDNGSNAIIINPDGTISSDKNITPSSVIVNSNGTLDSRSFPNNSSAFSEAELSSLIHATSPQTDKNIKTEQKTDSIQNQLNTVSDTLKSSNKKKNHREMRKLEKKANLKAEKK